MTTQPSPTGPLGDELRNLLRLIEDVPSREPEPQREATIIPARTSFERNRPREEAIRRPTTSERPVPPAPPVAPMPPPAREGGGLTMRTLSIAAVALAGAAVVAGWFVFGQRTNPTSALASQERSARASATTVTPAASPIRSATAPATHTPTPSTAPAPAPRPSLAVQSITTMPNERVRFLVRIEPMASADSAFLRLQGLPKGATLSRGRSVPPDGWVVPAGDFAALELTLGDVAPGRFELAAELQADNGRSLAQTTSLLVVNARPADRGLAPTVSREIARPSSPNLARESSPGGLMISLGEAADQTQDKFLAQGLRLLLAGSVNSARLMLQRAADAGNANAALILGDTYDDVRLSQLGVQGVLADIEKANFWYGRADELGAPEAKERLSEINSR